MGGRVIHQQVTLIVPRRANIPGMSLAEYATNMKILEDALVAQFGGFTAVDGHGAWESNGDVLHEEVRVYTLGSNYHLDGEDLATLRRTVKILLDQRAVYLAAYDLAEEPVR